MKSIKGFTIVELMITLALTSIMVVAVVPLLKSVQQNLTSAEAENSMKSANQKALNKIEHQLVECKRIFQNRASDNPFVGRLTLTGLPTPVNTVSPLIQTNGGITPSTNTFVSSSVGNALVFASIDQPVNLIAADSTSSTQTVRIDLYHFNAYYVAYSSGPTVGGSPATSLYEWHSISYADYNQITGISDTVEEANTAAALASAGYPYAWDPSTSSVTAAFYSLSSGTITALPNHMIPESSAGNMLKIVTGVLGGFHYTVSPNTSATFVTNDAVPKFATASGNFPGGLEIVIVGANSARQVFIRLVLVAEGSFAGLKSEEETVLVSARDLW